ncbi:c-type cytochrome [Pyxidicoccus fallax]|uniref:C-type cytochrome n=1 Tax=Pyxidicoccus fallax TaxID=394095 RepID=A0A848LCM9_9BACT|nr:c-type cytochrome [Pyxidicoccus fallax]NMO14031.1 c-type cytochrome [Pyxidicoccus fallax]NPC76637.1 c-type cytochrome [Pyxidicoccus fallax]
MTARGATPRGLLTLAALTLAVACRSKPAPTFEPLKLADGRMVPAATLSRGHAVYTHYCASCHGEAGDGQGPAGRGMRPVPRSFRQGLFKFGGVAAGELPTDDALKRTLRRGLHGTPMFAWDVPDADVDAVVQYLKTFSPRWREESPGQPLAVSSDPWKGRESEAVERGKVVYHVAGAGNAGCASCHVAYLPRAELAALMRKALGRDVDLSKADPYTAQPRDSDHAVVVDSKGEPTQLAKVLPPDFLFHPLRTVWPEGDDVEGTPYTAERQREDLYRVIAAGVGGAAMPTWKGAIPEENLWALAYYVQSLVRLRDTDEARALKERLRASTQAVQ